MDGPLRPALGTLTDVGSVLRQWRIARCGEPLRSKIVEYFQGEPELGDGGLRVSVYLKEPQHVRLSIWRGSEAQAALSLELPEADRLVRFLQGVRRTRLRDFETDVRRSVRGLAASVSEVSGAEPR